MFTNAPARWSRRSCSRRPLVLTLLLVGATTLTVPLTATAGVYRCTNAAGEVSYSEVNCPADFAKQELDISAHNPEAAPATAEDDRYSILNQARAIDEQQAIKAKARAEARERDAQVQAQEAQTRAREAQVRDAEARARDAEVRAQAAEWWARDAQVREQSERAREREEREHRAHERGHPAETRPPHRADVCPDGSSVPCRGSAGRNRAEPGLSHF